MKQIVKKIRIQANILLITGLHIGGSKDNVEIGGIDNPVIKIMSDNGKPYIPGSSLKGKMRCLLEQIKGVKLGGSSLINSVFGFTDDKSISKLIVRDAYLTNESVNKLEACDNLDMPYTENKYENTIDRYTGTTIKGGIRQTERVPAGVSFKSEFIINVWKSDEQDEEKDKDNSLALFKDAINALENDYLGGSGSRGYGQIKFEGWKYYEASKESEWKMKEVKDLITW